MGVDDTGGNMDGAGARTDWRIGLVRSFRGGLPEDHGREEERSQREERHDSMKNSVMCHRRFFARTTPTSKQSIVQACSEQKKGSKQYSQRIASSPRWTQ